MKYGDWIVGQTIEVTYAYKTTRVTDSGEVVGAEREPMTYQAKCMQVAGDRLLCLKDGVVVTIDPGAMRVRVVSNTSETQPA